jgi:hypothetical protein
MVVNGQIRNPAVDSPFAVYAPWFLSVELGSNKREIRYKFSSQKTSLPSIYMLARKQCNNGQDAKN